MGYCEYSNYYRKQQKAWQEDRVYRVADFIDAICIFVISVDISAIGYRGSY